MPEEVVPTTTEETPAPTAAEFAALKAETDLYKTRVEEHQRTAQYWFDQVNAKGKPEPKPAAAAAPAEEEEETDLLELITTKGQKGFDAYLAKRGFAKNSDVDATVNARVNAKANQLTNEAQLVKRYPDLSDDKSEFFKATATHYGNLKDKGVPEHMAMTLAAEAAELEGFRAGTIKTPAEVAAATKAAKEQNRLARINAQSGGPGARASETEESDDLTPEQTQVAIRMLAVDGVTAEQAIEKYKARAKIGVAMKGGIESRRAA